MSEAATVPPAGAIPPPKKSPVKWIVIGCGGLFALGLLCFGGCFVAGYFGIKKGAEDISPVGEVYLRAQAEVEEELGKLTRVELRLLAGTQIHVEGSRGRARLGYEIEGPKGKADATVWFERDGERWKAVGCEVRLSGGRTIKVGRSVTIPSSTGSSWDD
ncbi:MAG: hypothetical protein HYY17_07045 [Planctomycetes bacterium]|nr:hypothetical protein [Planctomycetota bacterium]